MAEHQKEEWELPRMLEDIRQAEARISDQNLELAIRQGLELGKVRRRKIGLRRRITLTAGALACSLAVLFAWQLWPPADSSPGTVMGSSPAVSSIPKHVLSMMHDAMKKAAEQGLYQPINKATEQDGYRLTVDGVLADKRTMIVFVTSEILSNTVTVQSIQGNFFSSNNELTEKHGLSSFGSNLSLQDQNIQKKSYYYTLQFKDTPGQMMFSEEVELDIDSSTKKLEFRVPINIDKTKFSSLEKSVPVHQFAQIGEHKLELTRAVLNPLSTTLEFKATSKTQNEGLKNLRDAKLYLGETRKDQFQPFLISRDTMIELINEVPSLSAIRFDSLYYTDWTEFSLRAKGASQISVYEKGKVAINTEEKKVITPNSPLRLQKVSYTKDTIEVVMEYLSDRLNPESSIHLDTIFSDRDGKTYSIEGGIFSDPSALLSLKSQVYPQPLTFSYRADTEKNIEQPIEFRIKLK
ncbi:MULTISPECIES: DUF4179 domain-containing protein [Paenibacillus]|uniref:DUF4179 domain-containing protein n=1 Tax=Paenibacillus TaxID=44249 RepID=UPI002FE2F610